MKVSQNLSKDALAAIDAEDALSVVRRLSQRASLLEMRMPDQEPQRLLMLQHSLRDRQRNPHIARDEFNLLRILCDAGMPVAKPIDLILDHEIPYLLTEHVPGESRLTADDLPDYCDELAQILSAIHSFDIVKHDLSFLPAQLDRIADELRSIAADDLGIRRAMQAALPQISMNPTALLHGDFWLGNLLWHGCELAAIIDWEDAMLGDPMGDLGKSRLEMLWMIGAEGMERFTASYLARNLHLNADALPFWDLWGALRLSHFEDWSEEPEAVARMGAQYQSFVGDAIRRLKTIQK